ncbi:WD40-repeat-containing domain protein, partial [Thamnocephalis sphaerospora]
GALFQSDSALIDGQRRRTKKEQAHGEPLELPTKILCMTLAPTGRDATASREDEVPYAYVGGANHAARKVNLKTGKTTKLYQGHAGPVTSVAVFRRPAPSDAAAEEECLLTGSWDKTLRAWNAQTKEVLVTMRGHTDFIKAVAIGKDHLIEGATTRHPRTAYSVSADGTARRWDLATGACLCVYEGEHRGQVESVAVTHLDGVREWLWTAGTDGTVRRWDAVTGACVAILSGHLTSVFAVHTPPNSDGAAELWSASADKTVRRWDLDTHDEDTVLEHPDAVRCVGLVGPYAVTGSRDEHVRVFNIAASSLQATIVGHYDEVTAVEMHAGILYTASLDCTIRRWSLAGNGKFAQQEEDQTLAETKEDSNLATPADRPGLMTEEEERELAELMSD